MMEAIRFDRVSKVFGESEIFRELSFSVPFGGITALVAPSGFGKTTLLRMVAGLDTPTSGTVTGILPEATAYVFQEPRLFPLPTWQNIACVLPGTREEKRRAAMEWLDRVGLRDAANKHPSALSGGMQARVSLARGLASLAAGRQILLLDEPFSGVDASCKEALIALVKETLKGKTGILVTHDSGEISALADTVITPA